MNDPLLELQVILGVFFWLGLHRLLDPIWRIRHPQCGHSRRRQKAKYPPLISSRRGRRRQVKTSGHYCPNKGRAYYGWLNRGNIRANGHPNGRAWRQLHCLACGHYFLETHGTLFYGKQYAPELILYALCCLAEGVGLRVTARIFAVDAKTVLS